MLDLRRKPRKGRKYLNVITLLMFACLHGHFREDPELTPIVVRHAANGFEINLFEPNLIPPLTTGEMVMDYQRRLQICFEEAGDGSHRLIATLYVTEHTTREMIERAYELGVRVVKLYYKVTTNSENGVTHWREAEVAIQAMEDICRLHPDEPMFLQVHAEALGFDHQDREAACVAHMEDLVAAHPDLWIAIEHVTTRVMLEFVERHFMVGASLTLHHLFLTWDDDCVHEGCLDGHAFCAPVCKTEDDRQALLDAALGKVPGLRGKVWLGLDFAPHPISVKDGKWPWPSQEGQPMPKMGVYVLDVAVPLLVALFERYGGRWWLKKLERFASTNGPDWYRIARPTRLMRVVLQPNPVPEVYCDSQGRPLLRSLMAGKKVDWVVEKNRIAA